VDPVGLGAPGAPGVPNPPGVGVAGGIWVQFAPVIDETTILSGNAIRVVRTPDGQEVKGSWKASHGGTKFTFVPDQPLEKGSQYEVSVTKAVKDKAGTSLEAARTIRFKTAE
jgi:hypothetical protein